MVLVRTASPRRFQRVHTIYVFSKIREIMYTPVNPSFTMESLFCGHAGCGHAGCGHAGHRLPAIVYVKPKICDQCYFSYYPPPPPHLPPAAYSNKKGKKGQCTIINTMCIVVKNLYALYAQLSEPLNSLYTLAT